MHLKSLTVKGFKSFAEPTTLVFEPGVTCVVGPNGSGKSNVVDALAWVMGEQGAKSLRGGSMEDVIFAGTQSRGPLGRAEVSLTIDNHDGVLPIDYTEVTISRTLFRNGASEYAINREPCRLLDVQELLSDTGLGREMHVIVGQGQLDRVLYASSDDRRRFIEEAAGITKHRRRKEKTVRKLEAMEGNLTRLNDLVNEIRRQLKPLGRQAEVAREAQTIQATVRDAKARLLADDIATVTRELADYQASESNSASERAVVQSELDRVVAEVHHHESQRDNNAVSVARDHESALRQVAERIDSLHALATERVSLLASADEPTEIGSGVSIEDIHSAQGRLADAIQGVANAEVELGDVAAQTATARAALEAFDAAVDAARTAREAWLRDNQERQEALAVALSRIETTQGDVEAAKAGVEAADARITQLERQWAQASSDDDTDNSFDSAEVALHEAWQAETKANERVDTLRHELHQAEREKDALAATIHTLRLAIEAESTALEVGTAGVDGRVAELLSITPGFETAVARGLGVLADALVVGDREVALRLSESISGDSSARLSLVVNEDRQPREVLALEGLTPATDVVTGPPGVVRVVDKIFIASSWDEVRRYWVGNPNLPDDVVIVTKQGDVFSHTLVQAGGGSQRSTVELIAERDQATADLQRVSTDVERAAATLAQAQQEATAATNAAKQALQVVRESEASRAARSEALSSLAATLDSARAERERAQARVDSAEAAHQVANDAHAALVAEAATSGEQPEPQLDLDARDELVTTLETARATEVDARVRLESARADVGYRENEIADLEQRQQAWVDARAREAARATQRRAMHQAATDVAALTPGLVAVARASIEQASARVAAAEAERSQSSAALQTLRAREAELRQRLSQITESVHSTEMHIYERNLQLQQLTERASDELGLTREVLATEYGPDQLIPDPDSEGGDPIEFNREDQQKRLASAHKKLDALGRVNPLALEEFDALEKRHQYLVEQLADVQASKADLLSIVDDIDDTMRDVFMDAFADTKQAFDEVFPVLFPGGTGSLSLSEPDNPLTTGVDVSVRPRGKKIERLSLLSGGERSLAAVALLIAIFVARPSPFYILDEIEAALDDANLGRLLEVMESLRADSQLIIITHQKRTMEIADALYGVSMRDDGVSAVVGQRVVDQARSA